MGIAELDVDNQLISLRATIILYGDAATEQLCREVAADIESHWNEPAATVYFQNIPYRFQFKMQGLYAPQLRHVDIHQNDNPLNNYFRIEAFSDLHISFVDGLGCNTGYFKLDNLLNNSTTAAHEFGHTLGLDHPLDLDIRGRGIPGIMYPRGTITDPQFQYDPEAAPATKGGTLNPFFRKVLQTDIDDLHLAKKFSKRNSRAVVGEFSSVWHDKHGSL